MKSSLVLQVASFTRLVFTDLPTSESTGVAATEALRSIKLRELSLAYMGGAAQASLLRVLSLPSDRLTITKHTTYTFTWEQLLHPHLAVSLGPLNFPRLEMHRDFMELREPDAEIRSATDASPSSLAHSRRCRLSLRLTGVLFHVILINGSSPRTPTLDLARVRTLVLTDVAEEYVRSWGFATFQHLRGVETLVLHNSWWTRKALEGMPALREICVRATDLAAGVGMSGTPSRLVVELVEGMALRELEARRQRSVDYQTLQRVTFERCTGLRGNLGLLRVKVEVLVFD